MILEEPICHLYTPKFTPDYRQYIGSKPKKNTNYQCLEEGDAMRFQQNNSQEKLPSNTLNKSTVPLS